MKSKKELFTLIAAVLAGLGALFIILLQPIKELAGFDYLFGYTEEIPYVGEMEFSKFNILGLVGVLAGIAVCVLLVLTKLGKFNKDLTIVYIVVLAVAGVLAFLAPSIIPLADGLDGARELLELGTGGLLSALCSLGGAALLAVNKWVIKE